ncbi:DNA cytosine methyltransferase [Vreelandella venusta]|uniref:DNA cytosine methyltransferase n=1 Tax=Vreelandella venusta TaxID=44935 RepID=UPI00384FE399
MKIVDLFSGLGGLTVGSIEASRQLNTELEIVFACDINAQCAKFYKHNFSKYIRNYHTGSILDIDQESLSGSVVDYLFAGPPCQGHSDLNNSSRRSDPRNLLYLETVKMINFFNPKVFVIENVPTVVHAKEGVVLELRKALSHDYNIKEYVVDFFKLGVAQKRKRHILIGSKSILNDGFFDSIYEKFTPKTLKNVIFDLRESDKKTLFDTSSKMSEDNFQRASFLVDNGVFDLPNHLRPKCHQGKHSYKSMYGRLSWDKPSQTITGGFGSMGQGRYLHPSGNRVITPHEAARIQDLPDWLDFSMVEKRGELHKMIGNAVPPRLSKELIIKLEAEK